MEREGMYFAISRAAFAAGRFPFVSTIFSWKPDSGYHVATFEGIGPLYARAHNVADTTVLFSKLVEHDSAKGANMKLEFEDVPSRAFTGTMRLPYWVNTRDMKEGDFLRARKKPSTKSKDQDQRDRSRSTGKKGNQK